jgi:hypothetical protein
MDSIVRRALLKPIAKRKSVPKGRETISEALDFLESRTIAVTLLPTLAQIYKDVKEQEKQSSWKDPDTAKTIIGLAMSMLLARSISTQEYTFLVAMAAERVNDCRIETDSYPEIVDLMEQLRLVHAAHGLGPDDYWRVGEGPPEYEELNRQFDEAVHKRFIETLLELGVDDIADLYTVDRQEFDRRRERGRRVFFHKDEMALALADTAIRYEIEAKSAASVGAYTAAVTLLGAAVEGLLVLRCLRSPIKARRVAASLPRAKRPNPNNGPTKWSFDTLIETCLAAGWLPDLSTAAGTLVPGELAHSLRQMRNYIHPGRVVEDRPWIEADQIDYTSAEAIFTAIFSTVSGAKRLKLLRETAQCQEAL